MCVVELFCDFPHFFRKNFWEDLRVFTAAYQVLIMHLVQWLTVYSIYVHFLGWYMYDWIGQSLKRMAELDIIQSQLVCRMHHDQYQVHWSQALSLLS